MASHERTHVWQDPDAGIAAALERPPIEVLQAMIDGELPSPPIASTMGFALVEVRDGFAAFEGTAGPWLANPMGGVHGGLALTLLDSATGCATHTTLPAGGAYTTVDLTTHMVRAITPGTALRCEGRVLHRGRRLQTATAEVRDDRDRLLAHGTAALMILSGG